MPYYERAARHPLPPANIGTRWVARLIDSLIVGGVSWVATKAGEAADVALPDNEYFGPAVYFVYEALFLLAWGTTPGKRVMKLAVADYRPGYLRPATWQIVLRAALFTLPAALPGAWGGLAFVILIPVLWDGLGLHDRATRTMVVEVGTPEPDRDEPGSSAAA